MEGLVFFKRNARGKDLDAQLVRQKKGGWARFKKFHSQTNSMPVQDNDNYGVLKGFNLAYF